MNKKKMRRKIGIVALVFAIVIVMFISAHAAQISVTPECQIVPPGESFTVNIYVDPEGNETFGADYILSFNNTLLNATLQTNGTFLSQDGADTYKVSIFNNTLGIADYSENRQGVTNGVTTPGTLATITFRALDEWGFTDLNFTKVTMVDPELDPISVNGSNGSVRIGVCGDVASPYGKVDWTDAMKVMYYALDKPITLKSKWAGDVAPPYGKIDWTDAMKVMYYALDKPVDLRCRCGE